MFGECCRCPDGLVPLLDRKVIVATKCGEITGFLRAVGETFPEVEEKDPRLELAVHQVTQIRHVRAARS